MIPNEQCLALAAHYLPGAPERVRRELAELFHSVADSYADDYETLRHEHALCDRWNAKYPPGTPVIVKLPEEQDIHTTTRGEAYVKARRVLVPTDWHGTAYGLRLVIPVERNP